MEHKNVANDLKTFKIILAHTRGGSIYISKEVEREIATLGAKDRELLRDELDFRYVKLFRIKKLNFLLKISSIMCYNENTGG